MMGSGTELRDEARSHYETTILFEHYPSGKYYEGKMYNYSRGGLYFESDFAPKTGTEIFIGVENSPYSPSHDVYRAKVVWQKELSHTSSFFFHGIGAKYC